jgi:hypothetical protein
MLRLLAQVLLYDGSDVNLTPRKCSKAATGILPDLPTEGNANDVARCAYIDLLYGTSKEVVKLKPIVPPRPRLPR